MRLLAVCVGAVAPLRVRGPRGVPTEVASGIVKTAVSTLERPEPVSVSALGLAGDEQADPSVHGGLDKAVYLYPHEHYPVWSNLRAQAGLDAVLAPGALGENLLVQGLLETAVYVGDRLAIGDVVLCVESARQPCYKFNARMGFAHASKMMVQSGYTGFYCSVVRQGKLTAGDPILIQPGDRVVTVEQSHRIRNRGRPDRSG